MPAFNLRYIIHRLPLENRLDIFGFLTYAEWMCLAKHNRRTMKVLFANLRYLAPFPRLAQLNFVCLN
jgi:hypothetical protein